MFKGLNRGGDRNPKNSGGRNEGRRTELAAYVLRVVIEEWHIAASCYTFKIRLTETVIRIKKRTGTPLD